MVRLFEVHPGGWPRYRMLTKWERFRQRLREAWWVLTDEYRLHRAWQAGYDRGRNDEYKRLIVNKACLNEMQVHNMMPAAHSAPRTAGVVSSGIIEPQDG